MITLTTILSIGVFLMFREERKLTKKGKEVFEMERFVDSYRFMGEKACETARSFFLWQKAVEKWQNSRP